MDFYDAWEYLNNHRYFTDDEMMEATGDWYSCFTHCLVVDVLKVNPETLEIDDNPELNTRTRVWLECGTWEWDDGPSGYVYRHDYILDCGGDTFEEAIMTLAKLVEDEYPKDAFEVVGDD